MSDEDNSNNDSPSDVPKGFYPFPLDNSFNDVFAPLYICVSEDVSPRFALKVEKQHLNPMGICHGAVYMALFDLAFPGVIGYEMGKYVGTPTMSINVNYMKLSKEGEWLYTEVHCDKIARTAAFAHGALVNSEGEMKATATGIFKVPDAGSAKVKEYRVDGTEVT